jgi:putative transposase
MYFQVGYTDLVNTNTVSRRIRVYPNKEQRAILRNWFGTSRFIYNQVVAYLKQPGTISSWYNLKGPVLHALPNKWSEETPYQIRTMAVKDACKAVSKAKLDYKKTGKFCDVKFRCKKALDQSIYIPKSAVTSNGTYYTLLGDLFCSEKVGTKNDSRLVYDHGRWFLCITKDVIINKTENQGRMVAIDPGIRTFATFYANDCCGKIGFRDFGRIQRLCEHLDELLSRIALAKNSKVDGSKIRNMKKAANRMRLKISDLIDELHHKVALFFVLNFDIIVIPKFETQNMVNKHKIGGRKLKSNSVRSMLTFSHYKFHKFLEHKAKQYDKIVVYQCEAYTSKTCSWNGKIIENLGNKKYIKDGSIIMDRDLNGARGIYLRALCEIPPSVAA